MGQKANRTENKTAILMIKTPMKDGNLIYPSDVAFSPAVKALQAQLGSRAAYAKMEQKAGWQTTVDAGLNHFLGQVDSFYMATANSLGQPYIQHRGGPTGFLKVLDEKRLAFADFSGNRQYISVGNLSENDQAMLFLMDYPNRRRIKIWGKAKVVEADNALLKILAAGLGKQNVERAIEFTLTAWDVNCPQHITPRFTAAAIKELVGPLQEKITELEKELAKLRNAKN